MLLGVCVESLGKRQRCSGLQEARAMQTYCEMASFRPAFGAAIPGQAAAPTTPPTPLCSPGNG